MMTKKHYVKIAEIINKDRGVELINTPLGFVMEDLADYFEQDNPKFNRERFLKACGVGE